MSDYNDDDDDENNSTSVGASTAADVPLLLLTIPECFVYKTKPIISNLGHRAEDWDLPNPALTGSVKIVSVNDIVIVQILNKDGKLFAACPIKIEGEKALDYFIEDCRDTSRYMAIRIIDDKSKRQAILGIGFRERDSAFSFRAAIDDALKRISRFQSAKSGTKKTEVSTDANKTSEETTESVDKSLASTTAKSLDLGLKKTIKINLKGVKNAKQQQKENNNNVDDEEWGDFAS